MGLVSSGNNQIIGHVALESDEIAVTICDRKCGKFLQAIARWGVVLGIYEFAVAICDRKCGEFF